MGLFHMNYDRPGPGVRKDEPRKKAVPRFFTILGRKFTQMVELNLLFAVFAAAALAVTYVLRNALPAQLLWMIPILLISPFVAGLAFVTRNYVREEHAFLFSDFMDAVKGNWKAFFVNGAVCCALYLILSVSIRFYFGALSGGAMYYVALCLCVTVAFLLVSAEYYVPVMVVTFDLKLLQIYKNALIFAVVGLWRNILLTVILAALFLGLFLAQMTALSLILGLVFVFVLLFSFVMFLINFAVYPLIDRLMIQPYQKSAGNGEKEGDAEDETPDFKDN